jgi:photosystem II stability/assembly factor-like uncharacterized protein
MSWTRIPGSAKRISVAPKGYVWALDPKGIIYEYDGGGWKAHNGRGIPGGVLSEISVGNDGTVWGLTAKGEIFRRPATGKWTQLEGNLSRISAADKGNVWGVNRLNNIWRWD